MALSRYINFFKKRLFILNQLADFGLCKEGMVPDIFVLYHQQHHNIKGPYDRTSTFCGTPEFLAVVSV